MRKLFLFLLLNTALCLGFGCSSDPDTPLGVEFRDDGLINSQPGEVFQDTVLVTSGDTSFAVNSLIPKQSSMMIGRTGTNEMAMLVRVNFSSAGLDTGKQVQQATLNLRLTDDAVTDTMVTQFFELMTPFTESDTLTTLNLAPIPISDPDSVVNGVDRVIRSFPRTHELPPALVQDWIRGDMPHNGIAVVLNDTTANKVLHVGTRENAESGRRPFLKVFFTDNSESTYFMNHDGTFVKALTAVTNLRLSDGVTRRVFVPLDLSQVDTETLLHNARLILHLVSGSSTGGDLSVTLYSPNSDDISDPGVLKGTPVTVVVLNAGSGKVELSVRNIIASLISAGNTEHAFVLQYTFEGTSIRQIEFHSSNAADSLKPSLNLTFSSPPAFP